MDCVPSAHSPAAPADMPAEDLLENLRGVLGIGHGDVHMLDAGGSWIFLCHGQASFRVVGA